MWAQQLDQELAEGITLASERLAEQTLSPQGIAVVVADYIVYEPGPTKYVILSKTCGWGGARVDRRFNDFLELHSKIRS